MKLLVSVLLLVTPAFAATQGQSSITGTWRGSATVHGQQVPVVLQITGGTGSLQAALLNGPESSPASSAVFSGNHLLVSFNYYARTLDATLANGHLSGTFGTATTRYPIDLAERNGVTGNGEAPGQDIGGEWEIAVKSAKGESAWQLRVEPAKSGGGDTGGGSADRRRYRIALWRMDREGLSNQSLHGCWPSSLFAGSASGRDLAGVESVARGYGGTAESGGQEAS